MLLVGLCSGRAIGHADFMTGWGLRLCCVMGQQKLYRLYSEIDRAIDWNLQFGRSLVMKVVFSGHMGSTCIPRSWVGSEIMLYD